jgi:hypothetical protein
MTPTALSTYFLLTEKRKTWGSEFQCQVQLNTKLYDKTQERKGKSAE